MVSARRRPAYLSRETARQDRWLASYADVITILLVLFIAAAAQGITQRGEAGLAGSKRVAKSGAPEDAAGPRPAGPDDVRLEGGRAGVSANLPVALAAISVLSPSLVALQGKSRANNADLRIEQRGVVISLPQAVLFQPGQARINREALSLVEEVADAIRSIPNKISLVGHSDGTPIRNRRFHNNWDLSMARSVTLLETLTHEFDIPEHRFSIASFGPYQPKATNETPEGRAENRRVEIVILAVAGKP